MGQIVLQISSDYAEIDAYLDTGTIRKILLVCGKSVMSLRINEYFEGLELRMGIKVVRFCEFTPNPTYESVVAGVQMFRKEKCDLIVAVGGGSAMDVAKCIKLYSNMDESENYLEKEIVQNDIKLFAIPTTAGTGSEATRFAVIYYGGEKQSVSDWSCIPSIVFMDASLLETLPSYQRKVTMLDALCHAIESYWSVHSTEESKAYAKRAVQIILENGEAYLNNDTIGNKCMLEAAYQAGRAINITQTTAGHAMSYKLTSLYGIAHGHAVALCVIKLWPYMIQNIDKCIDPRGKEYLQQTFNELAEIMECDSVFGAISKLVSIFELLNLQVPVVNKNDYNVLRESVNLVRLRNNPVELDGKAIDELYHQILAEGEK